MLPGMLTATQTKPNYRCILNKPILTYYSLPCVIDGHEHIILLIIIYQYDYVNKMRICGPFLCNPVLNSSDTIVDVLF